jgi:hypothetical protein
MVKVPVNTVKRASFARSARVTVLALGLVFGPEACTLPKFTAGSGVRGDITPQTDTLSAADTLVVPSSKKKKHKADVVLIYVIAFLIVAITYVKISNTDAR